MKLGRPPCSSHSRRYRFFPYDIGQPRPWEGFVEMDLRLYFGAILDTQLVLEKVGQRPLERLDLVGHVGTDPDLERASALLVALAAPQREHDPAGLHAL